MRGIRFSTLATISGVGFVLLGCKDAAKAPTAVDRMAPPETPRAAVVSLDPFTYRAAIDPYKILQLPDFMMQSRRRSDIVMQRSVLTPGLGPWVTHPGPSFVYVIQGQIKLIEFSDKEGCTETAVRGPGDIFFVEGDHIHRAFVVSSESAVLQVTRFNIPVGGALTIPVADPGC
jgi:hypothetical protein